MTRRNVDFDDMHKPENILTHPTQGVHSKVDKTKQDILFTIDEALPVNVLEMVLNIAGDYDIDMGGLTKKLKATKSNKKRLTVKVIIREDLPPEHIAEGDGKIVDNSKIKLKVKQIDENDDGKKIAKVGKYNIVLDNVTKTYWAIVKTLSGSKLIHESPLSTRVLNQDTVEEDGIYKTGKTKKIGWLKINGVSKHIEKTLDYWEATEFDDGRDRPEPEEKP